MRRAVIALFILAGCATAKQPDVREAQALRFLAMLKSDAVALAPMLADDLVYVHSTAAMETKQQFLENLRTGAMRYHAFEPSETVVRTYGPVAIITGRVKGQVTMAGNDRDIDILYTSVYRLNDGRWQLVSWQSTRVP